MTNCPVARVSRTRPDARVAAEDAVGPVVTATILLAGDDGGVCQETSDVALSAYKEAPPDRLSSALAILALLVVVALLFAQRISTVQPGRADGVGGASSSP
jgi:hypothetical protein